jgi:biotin synthase
MVGIPGQSRASIARDIATFRELDLDMIGVGPYVPNPETPIGRGEWSEPLGSGQQAPATADMVYAVTALARLACPEANIPSAAALAVGEAGGPELGLSRGANMVVLNLTPRRYRELCEIHPSKACLVEAEEGTLTSLQASLKSAGRSLGEGPGSRRAS